MRRLRVAAIVAVAVACGNGGTKSPGQPVTPPEQPAPPPGQPAAPSGDGGGPACDPLAGTCAQPQGASPCTTRWGGAKPVDAATADAIAIDAGCRISVAGGGVGPTGFFARVARLDAGGSLDQRVELAAELANSLAVDEAGNRYVIATTTVVPSGPRMTPGVIEIAISKLLVDGSAAWRQVLATRSSYEKAGIAVYRAGALYVVDGGAGPYRVSRLDPADGRTVWSNVYPSLFGDLGDAFAALDRAGNLFVTGFDSAALTAAGYVAKIAPDGASIWVRPLGLVYRDRIDGIGVDDAGNLYVVGSTRVGSGDAYLGQDAYLVKLDPEASVLWKQRLAGYSVLPGTYTIIPMGVAVTGGGDAWLHGVVTDGALPGQAYAGSVDGFVAKYDSSGKLMWARQWGTTERDQQALVALDPLGNGYVTSGPAGSLSMLKLGPDGTVQ
jgi:hypothetical protein